MRMDSLQKSFLPMWQEEALAKVSRKLDIIDEDDDRKVLKHGHMSTDLFIFEGFKFNVVNSLITNFHLPQSSLLMLVSAFAGKKLIFDAYQYAIANKMRFFSYGDAMIIER